MSNKVNEFRIRQCLVWIEQYKGDEPLSAFLKKQFQLNKKMGSNDRRVLSDFMYQYYRLGNLLINEPIDKRIVIGQYLFNPNDDTLNELAEQYTGVKNFQPDFSSRFEEFKTLFPNISLDDLFPFKDSLSAKLDKDSFLTKIAEKPLVWLRVSTKNMDNVKYELNDKSYKFKTYEEYPNSLSLENAKGIDSLQSYQKGYFEVQDLSSQICSSLMEINHHMKIWDACAGAGGKSLQIVELYSDIAIVFTDIRETILENLKKRMSKIGLYNPNTYVMDLTTMDDKTDWPNDWDVIIADVPCTGSGTWGRAPENIYYSTEDSKEKYVSLQKQIVTSLSKYLKKGGILYYITCSVFATENENITLFAKDHLGLIPTEDKIIQGSLTRSDSMYISKLVKK
ncbi:MAG TPA: RsmB/NOP family class I SAM-dependent RNA methyltransferase [Saprospiraceae bacterium]|nr:RsmB/NOP family class I SAM-dependent RNA methyltransferase [Saprospiraceae bacterium]